MPIPESPIASPEIFVDKVDSLSRESLTVDRGVEKAKRDAMDFAERHGKNFSVLIELKTNLENYKQTWVGVLQETRDAASTLAAWYKNFVGVFIPWIPEIANEEEAKKVVRALKAFKKEPPVTTKYPLDGAPGVKEAFTELERLVVAECEKFVQELDSGNWMGGVFVLRPTFPGIKDGVDKIVDALESYATKLE